MISGSRSAGLAAAPFGRHHVPLPTAAEAAAADQAARDEYGIPERVLMENAGRAAALVLQRLHPRGTITGVAGSGNNGGDLLVMLRVLREWGRDVHVIAAGSRGPDVALAHGVDVPICNEQQDAMQALANGDVIVDGLLGTGASGAPRGPVADWIQRINAAQRPVLALDLPSGIDATTGAVPGDAVRAEVTIAFGWPKLGMLLQPARSRCGRLVTVEIGFPPGCTEQVRAQLITPDWVRRRRPAREPGAHKGTAGRLLIMAGSSGMAGAAAIACEAALRAGAGLLRVASDADNRVILQSVAPEATFLDRSCLEADDLEPMHAIVAGPGMGQTAETRNALERALSLLPAKPVLLDADALNVLAGTPEALRQIGESRPLVITPHARELSRLTDVAVEELLADPCGAARDAAARFQCTVLLKGQPSLVATPDGGLLVNTTGSSDVATAGMGDQLAGTIGAFLASGMDPVHAAGCGLFLSGRAADLCGMAQSLGPRDVSAAMPQAFSLPGLEQSPLRLPFVTFDQPPRW